MFSQTTEYALRAVVMLANSAPQAQTTDKLAQATKVPKAYLAKVLQALVRHGLVVSQRGVKGGVSLARSVTEITILDVVNAVDPIPRIHSCPLGIASHGKKLCPLHAKLDQTAAEVQSTFSQCSIGDMLSWDTKPLAFCEFPSPPRADG